MSAHQKLAVTKKLLKNHNKVVESQQTDFNINFCETIFNLRN